MKRWVGLTLALVIFSCIIIFAIQVIFPEPKIVSLESIIPEGPVLYLYCYNPAKKVSDLTSGGFFKQISALKLYKEHLDPLIEKAKKTLPFLPELLQRDVSVASFSLGSSDPFSLENNSYFGGDTIAVLRIDKSKNLKLKKLITDYYLSLFSKSKVTNTKFEGVEISTYPLPDSGELIYCAFLSDAIVISNNSGLIKKSIKLFKKKSSESLKNDENFKKALSLVKKDSLLWGFQDNKKYYQQMIQNFADVSLQAQKRDAQALASSFMKISPMVRLMEILDVSGFYLDYDESRSGFILRGYQKFDKAKDQDGILKIIATDRPFDKDTLNFVPRGTVFYGAANQDLPGVWKLLKNFLLATDEMFKASLAADPRYLEFNDQMDSAPGIGAMFEAINSYLGIDFEKEIIPLLGNNVGVVFSGFQDAEVTADARGQGSAMVIPLPQIYMFAEAKNIQDLNKIAQVAVKNLVDNLNKTMLAVHPAGETQDKKETFKPLDFKTTQYGTHDIYTLDLVGFPVKEVKPNYCILGNYIVFSFSPEITQGVIDLYQKKDRTFSLDYENYSHVFIFNSQTLIKDLRDTQFFKAQETSGNLKDIDPLLDVLSDIGSVSFSGRLIDSETMESDLRIKIKGL